MYVKGETNNVYYYVELISKEIHYRYLVHI
jgi:hypothetical protein